MHEHFTSLGCTGLDIAFIIDSSGSIKRENWPKVLNFVSSISQSLPIAPYLNRIAAVRHLQQIKTLSRVATLKKVWSWFTAQMS